MKNENFSSSLPQNKSFVTFPKDLEKNLPAFLMLVLFAGVIIARNPRFFYQPRFWAEEGSLHFAYSYNHSWFEALFAAQVGYLNFWPNLATLIATVFPLEMAPLITTIMALLVQLVPILLILFSNSDLWDSWVRKFFGIAIYMFSALTAEVWLNTANSYNYFAAITFLILLANTSTKLATTWLYRILLVLAGLSGTNSCFLIPLFLFRAVYEKNKERWWQTAILSFCALIQIALIFSYRSTGSFEQRFHLIGLSTFGVTMWTQSIALFAFGYTQAHAWGQTLFVLATQSIASFQMWGRLLLAAGVVLLFLLSSNLSRNKRLLFLGSYLILMLLPMMFSVIQDKYALIDTGLHQRIFFTPNIILGWMLLAGVRFQNGKNWRATLRNIVSAFCAILIGASLFWGIQTYRVPWFLTGYWPDWKTEVSAWRANPDVPLHIQPEGWIVQLKK